MRGLQAGRMLLLAVVSALGVATGASATPTALPSSINFGNVGINTTATLSSLLTIDAAYQVAVATGNALSAPFAFDFGGCGDSGGFTGPGTCSINESFTPTSFGLFSATLTVYECPTAGGSCVGVAIPVTGTGVSLAAASTSLLDFGNVVINTTATSLVDLTIDAGYQVAVATGSGLASPFSFNFDACAAGGGFAGPGSCTVAQSFSPTSYGPASGSTNVYECPVGGGSCIPIPYSVTGVGVAAPVPAVPEPASIAVFGIAIAGLLRRRKRG